MPDDSFPYLLEVSSDRSYPLGGCSTVTFGADGRADVALDECSGDQLLFQIESEDGQWFFQPLDVKATISVNQAPVMERTALDHLSIIQSGRRVFLFVERDDPAVSTSYSAGLWLVSQLSDRPDWGAASVRATVTIPSLAAAGAVLPLELPGAIELPQKQVLIGRDSNRVGICLPDVRVSRVHAWIAREGRTATIMDLKSANGTFVNGRPVRQPTVVREGSRIQIGPYNLIFRARALHPLSHDKNVQLVAFNLVRRVPDRQSQGRSKVILDDISLVIRPREFVCILGPSGSGKTTLLSALSARVPADEGSVLLNGEDLYAHFDSLKQNLAVVPQRDVLHDVLPLHVALWYSAKMRLPADMSTQDIIDRIDETLDSVNLVQHQYRQIRGLSGGQIKRASWANEAICNPSLIFLDEVTSGLDEQTDSEMMQLFRRMADDGKTIVCVTHSLSYVEQNCHLVAILAPGGVLAYFGPPADALEYFGVSRLGDVYQRFAKRSPEEWKRRFRRSSHYREYVERRLPDPAEKAKATRGPTRWQPRILLAAWRQFVLLTRRYVAIQWAHKRPLAMMLGQSLFIAGLLVWLFGDLENLDVKDEGRQLAEVALGVPLEELFPEDQEKFLTEAEETKRADRSSKLLFLLCIPCIWFGCNNAAKEIVKERTIYSKERDVGLKLVSYYSSKLALLGMLSVLQASLLYWIVRHFTQLGGDPAEQWVLLSFSSLTGVAMGLAISAIANTEDLAVTMVPIALIPQIVLAGLIAPLLNYTREFSQACISAYWSYQGLLLSLDESLQKRLSNADCLSLDDEWTLTNICCVLAAHFVFFSLVAVVALCARDAKDHRPLRWLLRR